MTGVKLLCYGAACAIGGIGLAILMGAIGADMLWRYIEERR